MTSSAAANGRSCVVLPASNPAASLQLFCFPYAGGGASVFSAWRGALPPNVEICAVQLPGREGRLSEPPFTRWPDVAEAATETLMATIARPFALFGHSLGALLAFEVARRLRRERRRAPVHLFVSGCRAPHLPLDKSLTYDLPTQAFVEELRRYGRTPAAVLHCAEVLDIYLPMLRADFRLAELYACHDDAPLSVPISVYGGTADDDVPEAKLDAWRRHTTSAFRRVMFEGGHFFLNERSGAVLSELSRELQTITTAFA